MSQPILSFDEFLYGALVVFIINCIDNETVLEHSVELLKAC